MVGPNLISLVCIKMYWGHKEQRRSWRNIARACGVTKTVSGRLKLKVKNKRRRCLVQRRWGCRAAASGRWTCKWRTSLLQDGPGSGVRTSEGRRMFDVLEIKVGGSKKEVWRKRRSKEEIYGCSERGCLRERRRMSRVRSSDGGRWLAVGTSEANSRQAKKKAITVTLIRVDGSQRW